MDVSGMFFHGMTTSDLENFPHNLRDLAINHIYHTDSNGNDHEFYTVYN